MLKIIKQFALGAITVILGLIFWRSLGARLNLTEIGFFQGWISVGIVFLLFMISLGLSFMLIGKKWIVLVISGLSVFSFFLFFGRGMRIEISLGSAWLWYAIGCILLFIVFIISYLRIRSEKLVRIKFKISDILEKGIPLCLTFLAILISLAFYFNYSAKIAQEVKIPEALMDMSIKPFEAIMKGFIPDYSMDMTIDEFLIQFSQKMSPAENKNELGTEELPFDIEKFLGEEEGGKIISSDVLEKEREGLSEQLGIKLTGRETLHDVFYKLVNQKFAELSPEFRKLIAIVLALSFFGILRIIFIPFGWLIILFTYVVFVILKKTGVVKIEQKKVEMEIVKL